MDHFSYKLVSRHLKKLVEKMLKNVVFYPLPLPSEISNLYPDIIGDI